MRSLGETLKSEVSWQKNRNLSVMVLVARVDFRLTSHSSPKPGNPNRFLSVLFSKSRGQPAMDLSTVNLCNSAMMKKHSHCTRRENDHGLRHFLREHNDG